MPDQAALDDICYRDNQLSDVIVRVDMASPVQKLLGGIPKPLSSATLGRFPISEARRGQSAVFKLGPTGPQVESAEEFSATRFHGEGRDRYVDIDPRFLLFVYKRYHSYESLREDVGAILDVFQAELPDAQPSRVGLRYVNQVRPPNGNGTDPLQWQEYIAEHLLQLISSYRPAGAEAVRMFHEFEFRYEGFNLAFKFGIHNPDYPSPIRRRVFVLDYDAYNQGSVEAQDIVPGLDGYHATIQSLFESSITDGLRQKVLGPTDEQD